MYDKLFYVGRELYTHSGYIPRSVPQWLLLSLQMQQDPAPGVRLRRADLRQLVPNGAGGVPPRASADQPQGQSIRVCYVMFGKFDQEFKIDIYYKALITKITQPHIAMSVFVSVLKANGVCVDEEDSNTKGADDASSGRRVEEEEEEEGGGEVIVSHIMLEIERQWINIPNAFPHFESGFHFSIKLISLIH